MQDKINLAEKFTKVNGYYKPAIIGQYNGNDLFLAKFKGAFPWHSHAETDDFFLVVKGEIDIELRDRKIHLTEGEVYVVPKGVEHRPVAAEEAHVLLIEPIGEPNTGDPATATAKTYI